LVQLFEFLVKNINASKPKDYTRDKIWARLWKEEKFDDVKMRKYFSDLLKLVESFLVQEGFENNPIHKATYLLKSVGDKKLDKIYNSSLTTARRLSDQQTHKPASFYYYQYQIEKNYYELAQFEGKREVSNIENISDNLDVFYLSEKLRTFCSILNRQYELSHEYHVLFQDEIIKHVERNNYEEYPTIAIYYQVYRAMVESENVNIYFKLKDLLSKYGLVLPTSEASEVYTFAINYCTRKINKGNQGFLGEYLDLYKDLLNKRIIFDGDELPPAHYKNIVLAGLRSGELTWTEGFIEDYKDLLPMHQRENAYTFNLAQLRFYQKRHNDVIGLLAQVEYEDLTYNLNSKVFLVNTYYETEETELLYSLIDTFRIYIKRQNKIPERRKKNYHNFLKFTKRLTRITPGDERAIEKLKKDIKESGGAVSLKWLNEKIAELEA